MISVIRLCTVVSLACAGALTIMAKDISMIKSAMVILIALISMCMIRLDRCG